MTNFLFLLDSAGLEPLPAQWQTLREIRRTLGCQGTQFAHHLLDFTHEDTEAQISRQLFQGHPSDGILSLAENPGVLNPIPSPSPLFWKSLNVT